MLRYAFGELTCRRGRSLVTLISIALALVAAAVLTALASSIASALRVPIDGWRRPDPAKATTCRRSSEDSSSRTQRVDSGGPMTAILALGICGWWMAENPKTQAL